MPPDFLDSREDAVAVWTAAILAYAFWKGVDAGRSVGDVGRALFQWKLLILFAVAGAYCAAVVVGAYTLGLWQTTTLKETIFWFFGSGVVLVGDATQASPTDPAYWRKLVRRVLRFTILIEFVVNLYVFPFAVELIIVPLILLFTVAQAYAEDGLDDARLRRLIDSALLAIGVALLLYFAARALTDLDGLLTRENAEELLIVPAMTLAFIPLLVVVAWVSRREQENLRKKFPTGLGSPA